MADPWASVPGGDSSTTTKPAAAAPQSLLDKIKNLWGETTAAKIVSAAPKALSNAANAIENNPVTHALQTFAALPSEGINAVLGAPLRQTQSAIGHLVQNPRGVGETMLAPMLGPAILADPAARKQIGHAVYATLHPNDPSIQANAEHATSLDKLLSSNTGSLNPDIIRAAGMASGIPYAPIIANYLAKNLPGIQDFAVHTAGNIAMDPLTYAGMGTAAAGDMALDAIGNKITKALQLPEGSAVRRTAEMFATNVPERQAGLTRQQIAAINNLRQKLSVAEQRVAHEDAKIVAADNGATPDLAKQLEKKRHAATQSELQQGIENILLGTKKPSKPTALYHQPSVAPESPLLPTTPKVVSSKPGYSYNQGAHAPPVAAAKPVPPPIRPPIHLTTEQRFGENLGGPTYKIPGLPESAQSPERIAWAKDIAAKLATRSTPKGFAPLRALSRYQAEALTTTGIGHMKNVGIAGYNAMGEGGLLRAVRFYVGGGAPESLRRRLEEGASVHFSERELSKGSPSQLFKGVRKYSTAELDRWDESIRAARLEQIDREHPGWTEAEKLDRVNQDIGAYGQSPEYVDLMRGYTGANFPQWHAYIVPTMVGRAALRSPGRIHRLAQAEQQANDTFAPNSPYRLTLGGPNDEAASAAADPARIAVGTEGRGIAGHFPTYFGGQSSLGIFSKILGPQWGTLAGRAAEGAAGFVPFGGMALDAILNPYKSPLDPLSRSATGAAGIYPQKRTKGSLARTRKQMAAALSGGDPWASIP